MISIEKNNQPISSEKKDETFDALKGFGILLMIWVHCKTGQISHFAYTFHMPLFFFISGFFFKKRTFKHELLIDFQRIIVPYVATCLTMAVLAFSLFDNFSFGSMTRKALFSTLWGGAIFGHLFDVPESLFIGPLWFLLGMFWTRLMAHFLFQLFKNDFICGSIIFILALIAKSFFEVFGHIPLSFVQSFGCLGFFYMGFLAKKYNLLSIVKIQSTFLICILCWTYCMTYSSLALHKCVYEGFYILDLLGAWGMFCILFIVTKKNLVKESRFWKIILFIGRNSIIVLCIHAIDHCMLNWWTTAYAHLRLFTGDVLITFFRLLLAVSLTYLVSRNKFINEKIFFMRKR